MPAQMIAQLQAIRVKDIESELVQHLKETPPEKLILPRPAPPAQMVVVADWPERRTELLSESANRVRDLGHQGVLRQRGALSSFCIPNKDIKDKAWDEREGKQRRGDFYRYIQRQERQALEWHASRAGCRLIIDPSLKFKNRGLEQTVARLETLLEFLDSTKSFPVEVVVSTVARSGSLTLVGEWFVAESMVPRPGGYRQTVFNWHAPTVSAWARRFDEQFMDLCRDQELDPRYSRERAIEKIRSILSGYRSEIADAVQRKKAGREQRSRDGGGGRRVGRGDGGGTAHPH
jgi:hypothetical protein